MEIDYLPRGENGAPERQSIGSYSSQRHVLTDKSYFDHIWTVYLIGGGRAKYVYKRVPWLNKNGQSKCISMMYRLKKSITHAGQGSFRWRGVDCPVY